MQFTNSNGNGILRTPTSAEQLLAELITDEYAFEAFRELINRAMFQDKAWIFDTLERLQAGEGVTSTGVIMAHPEQRDYLGALLEYGYNPRRIPTLIANAKKDLVRVQVRDVAKRIQWDSHADDLDPDDLLEVAQAGILGIERSTSMQGMNDPEEDIEQYWENLMEIVEDPSKAYGIMSGIGEIDRLLLGFKRQDFSVVGARTSMGKSAFAAQLAVNLATKGYKVAIFSLEMSKKQLYDRMFANVIEADAEFFKMGKLHRQHYDDARYWLDYLKQIYIDDTRGIDADYIADKVRRRKKSHGIDFVIVDYIQDISEKGEHNDNGGSAIGRICRKLRRMGQENNCHVMGLSQVVRIVEERQDKRPRKSDLSGSTGIETAADLIMMLYRDEYYNPDTARKGILEVNIDKNRNGKIGLVNLRYDTSTQRIK